MVQRGIDYNGVGVGAVLVDAQGRLFMAQRGPQAKNERGLWEFPGGSVEFGERLEDALKREMREEYGIEIEVGPLLDVVNHILPEKKTTLGFTNIYMRNCFRNADHPREPKMYCDQLVCPRYGTR